MLRIYPVILSFLRGVVPVVQAIEARDRDLARQLRRCGASIALNAQEGYGSRAGTRRERYLTALGSAREAGACLDVALALGYVQQLDSVRAVLATLSR
jgi:four helix bundle protein